MDETSYNAMLAERNQRGTYGIGLPQRQEQQWKAARSAYQSALNVDTDNAQSNRLQSLYQRKKELEANIAKLQNDITEYKANMDFYNANRTDPLFKAAASNFIETGSMADLNAFRSAKQAEGFQRGAWETEKATYIQKLKNAKETMSDPEVKGTAVVPQARNQYNEIRVILKTKYGMNDADIDALTKPQHEQAAAATPTEQPESDNSSAANATANTKAQNIKAVEAYIANHTGDADEISAIMESLVSDYPNDNAVLELQSKLADELTATTYNKNFTALMKAKPTNPSTTAIKQWNNKVRAAYNASPRQITKEQLDELLISGEGVEAAPVRQQTQDEISWRQRKQKNSAAEQRQLNEYLASLNEWKTKYEKAVKLFGAGSPRLPKEPAIPSTEFYTVKNGKIVEVPYRAR